MSIPGADATLACFHVGMCSRVHLSTVLFDHLDQGGHGFFLLQQLQSWGVWIRDVSQPVFAVVIPGVAFSSQQRPRTAFVDRDLWSRRVDITYFQRLKIAISPFDPSKTHIQTVAHFQDTQGVLEHVLQGRVAEATGDSQNLHVRVSQGHHEGLSIIDPNVHVNDQLLHPGNRNTAANSVS